MKSNYESNTGLGVNNHYGQVLLQDGIVGGGKLAVDGSIDEVVFYARGEDFQNGAAFDTAVILPAGAIVREVVGEVTEAFDTTTGSLAIGTSGTAATNYGITLAEGDLEATGTYEGTPAGTWAAPLAADTVVSVAMAGTVNDTSAGEAKVVVRYSKI